MTISQTTGARLLPEDGEPIVRVDAARRAAAVESLMAGPPEVRLDQARRFLDYAVEHHVDLRAMWARLDDRGHIRGTVLVVPNPGRTSMVFATPPRRRADLPALAALIDHACVELVDAEARDLEPVHLAQVLIEPEDRLERELFEAAGFHVLAHLSYLQRALPGPRLPDDGAWPDDVELLTYDESRRDDMLAVLEASYEQTLDCPGLLGLRRTDDVLRGHMATGYFEPALWTLMKVGGRPAGALLLNPSAQASSIELVYLGLARFARGRGLGRRLLRHGLRMVQHRPERLITLAVDDQNTPALRLYTSEGFKRRLRRVAMIRSIRRP